MVRSRRIEILLGVKLMQSNLQTASFLAFLVLLTLCVVRSRRTTGESGLPMKYVVVLFLASLLIFLRTIFRLAETAEGKSSPTKVPPEASKRLLRGKIHEHVD